MGNSENESQNFYSDDPINLEAGPKKRKLPTLLALLLLIVSGSYAIQTTLAANISLNNGARVEFGQGVAQTVACSGSQMLTITPIASLVNASGAGGFKFSGIRVDNIPTSCQDTDFTFSAYNNVAASAAQAIFNTSSNRAVVYMKSDNTFRAGTGGIGLSVATNSSSSFTVTFATPVAPSSDVYKLTVESAAHVDCSDGGWCAVGDTGLGGGIVFYYQSAGFTCGEGRNRTCNYLEASPNGWSGGSDPQTYGCYSGYDGSNTFGDGAYNSLQQRTDCSVYLGSQNVALAAQNVAFNYSNGGYSDWFIPNQIELNELCKYARGQETGNNSVACDSSGTLKSGFTSGVYMSSWTTERSKYAQDIDFSNGSRPYYHIYQDQLQRPIRAF